MSERNYYVICDSGCKFPAMTKEQILAAIDQAVSTGAIRDVDTGFVTKIKEMNRNTGIKWWVGTMAEYNAIEEKEKNCFYITTDDVSYADLIGDLRQEIDVLWEQFEPINTNIQNISTVLENTGLGFAVKKRWSEVDDVTFTGWFYFSEPFTIAGQNFSAGYMRVDAGGNDLASQQLFGQTAFGAFKLFRERKYRYNGDDVVFYWGEWEWENPPMVEGVEYKTPERWDGKAVYTKWETISLTDFDAASLSRGSQYTYHTFDIPSNAVILRHTATHVGHSLSCFNPNNATEWEYTRHSGQQLTVVRGAACNFKDTVIAQIWYTKG